MANFIFSLKWVQGAIPMFGFYKRWSHLHQSEQVIVLFVKTLKMIHCKFCFQNKNGKACDLFYNKLIPLLREQGISNIDNRKEWPLPVMRQVLKELMEETPSSKKLNIVTTIFGNRGPLNQSKSIAVTIKIATFILFLNNYLSSIRKTLVVNNSFYFFPDLLSQEFWFSSVGPEHWFELTQSITRSVAVMSIIGYIIGLGDRYWFNEKYQSIRFLQFA